jgi:hypothetical protein
MMMEFMKDKWSMEKNMVQASIFSKMEIFMMDRCIRAKCKEKESILGQIKTFMKEPLFKTK